MDANDGTCVGDSPGQIGLPRGSVPADEADDEARSACRGHYLPRHDCRRALRGHRGASLASPSAPPPLPHVDPLYPCRHHRRRTSADSCSFWCSFSSWRQSGTSAERLRLTPMSRSHSLNTLEIVLGSPGTRPATCRSDARSSRVSAPKSAAVPSAVSSASGSRLLSKIRTRISAKLSLLNVASSILLNQLLRCHAGEI
jgi:hypothetical protein